MADYFVYILSNKSRTLYVGIANNLERRVHEHRMKAVPGFTERYNVTRLVYYECTGDVRSAIEREKEIKGWVRRKKVALISAFNPEWKGLSLEWMPVDAQAVILSEQSERRISGRGGKQSKVYAPLPQDSSLRSE